MRVFKRLNIRLIGSCMAAVLLVFSVICTVFLTSTLISVPLLLRQVQQNRTGIYQKEW